MRGSAVGGELRFMTARFQLLGTFPWKQQWSVWIDCTPPPQGLEIATNQGLRAPLPVADFESQNLKNWVTQSWSKKPPRNWGTVIDEHNNSCCWLAGWLKERTSNTPIMIFMIMGRKTASALWCRYLERVPTSSSTAATVVVCRVHGVVVCFWLHFDAVWNGNERRGSSQ